MNLEISDIERGLMLRTGQGKRALKLALEGVKLLDRKQLNSTMVPTISCTQERWESLCDARTRYADSVTYWRKEAMHRMNP